MRISVACTTERRSSARVSASRSNPSRRDHSPTYIDGRVLRLDPADLLERPRQRRAAALQQALAREQGPVELPPGQGPHGRDDAQARRRVRYRAMDAVSIHEAKAHFSRLVARAEAGEEIIVRRGATPVAKIVAYTRRRRRACRGP